MISLITWNCQGIKNNSSWLKSVINGIDIIALQETWLFDFESNHLSFDKSYSVFQTSAMPNGKKLTGRPYGGLALLVKSNLIKNVKPFKIIDSRILAITVNVNDSSLLVINVYFPVNSSQNAQLISNYIGKINSLVINHNGPYVILGDFNISPNHNNFEELVQFCDDNECSIIDIKNLPPDTVTYTSKGNGASSWLDHVIVSNNLIDLTKEVSLPHVITPSDHVPLKTIFDIKHSMPPSCHKNADRGFQWKRANPQNMQDYCKDTHRFLVNLTNWSLCTEKGCKNPRHKDEVHDICTILVTCLQNSEQKLQKLKKPTFDKAVPGWNEHIKSYYESYRSSYLAWRNSGKVNSEKFIDMSNKRKIFKKALIRLRRHKSQVLNDELALSYEGRNFFKFWDKVKTANRQPPSHSSTIGGAEGDKDICDMWAHHYTKLFKNDCASPNHSCKSCDKNDLYRASEHDVDKCIKKLKNGKAAGIDKLTAESLKYADPLLNVLLAQLFNSCLAHAFIPDVIMRVVLVPILKKNGLDASVVKNYRPIALATIISKVFELLILLKYDSKLGTQPGQFGYKKGVGTETAIFTLRQITHHYLRRSTPTYLCYLDATAAFDNISHAMLLDKLCQRGIGVEMINFLQYWFNHQMFIVRWKNEVSTAFPVRQGVRQGGLNSSQYFAVFMDDLYVKLQGSGLGCHAGPIMCNYLAYADDICLMTTSISSLRRLITICEEYGLSHGISFNPSKSFLQCFVPKSMDSEHKPKLTMCGLELQWSDSVKYLGYDISCWERDTSELRRRKRELYMQANLVASRFSTCSVSVKEYIFKTFFSNIYCSSLWLPIKKCQLQSVKVAYNDAFRILFKYSRRCSATNMFAQHRIPDFDAVRRRSSFSLASRLAVTANPILKFIFSSKIFLKSSLYDTWSSILLHENINTNDPEMRLHQILCATKCQNDSILLGDASRSGSSIDEGCRMGQARSNTFI